MSKFIKTVGDIDPLQINDELEQFLFTSFIALTSFSHQYEISILTSKIKIYTIDIIILKIDLTLKNNLLLTYSDM